MGEVGGNAGERKRILVIHHGQGIGGGLIAMVGLLEQLRQAHQVGVLCIFDSSAVSYLRQRGYAVQVADSAFYRKHYDLFVHSEAGFPSVPGAVRGWGNLIRYGLSRLRFAGPVLRQYARDYDVVYLNSVFITDWAGPARALGKQVVVHVREPLARGRLGWRRALIRRAIARHASLVVAISNDNRARVGTAVPSVTVYDPVVLRSGRDQPPAPQAGCRYFCYVGGSQRIKGFEQLVEALPHLAPEVRIYFLGYTHEIDHLDGWRNAVRRLLSPYARKLPRLKAALAASPQVLRIGMTDDVFAYYRNAVAIISPFAAPHASLPVLEAHAMGKPVIVSDVAGSAECVDATTGMMFANGDARALAAAINRMAALAPAALQQMAGHCLAAAARREAGNPDIGTLVGQL